ncbi:hypothetical protein TCDM_14255 [Trypanosoma cruzi Dm28c]|uniref:Rhodanese domain-containing protein n=1 Tax=Trypanosoma cruzi Dm28c TaxID=1416333 RepID=V5BMN9_TRYCR|nr:hypothetical protein TCDM_14255 [Trypanosoma cruzi Dm28c]
MQNSLDYAAIKDIVANKLRGELKTTHLIDVRGRDEVQSTGLIPTAINIPLDELESALKADHESFQKTYAVSKPLQDHTLVMYCKKGLRGMEGEKRARQCGYTNTAVYPGSWDDWSKNTKEQKEE